MRYIFTVQLKFWPFALPSVFLNIYVLNVNCPNFFQILVLIKCVHLNCKDLLVGYLHTLSWTLSLVPWAFRSQWLEMESKLWFLWVLGFKTLHLHSPLALCLSSNTTEQKYMFEFLLKSLLLSIQYPRPCMRGRLFDSLVHICCSHFSVT